MKNTDTFWLRASSNSSSVGSIAGEVAANRLVVSAAVAPLKLVAASAE